MIDVLGRLHYLAAVFLVAVGLFVLIDDDNLLKKVLGLNVFQTGVFLFFVTVGYRRDGAPPILTEAGGPYVNPLPQVLMLTAIVVGVSVTALALALVLRVYRAYGTLSEDAVREAMADE